MTIDYSQLPSLAQDPAHDAVVSTLNRLRQTQVERFFARATGSHAAAIFLREVLYWLSPSNKASKRPRSTVYRNRYYWMARTQKQWEEEHFLSRSKLETVYERCEDFIEIDHFMFGRQRQTHYRIKFERLREEMERDEALQACLQSDLAAAKSRTAPSSKSRTPVCGSFRSPSLHSVCDSFNSIENTGCAGTCACSPSATGAAAPEPPPPARVSTLDSVEAALTAEPAEPQVTSFKQAQAILRAAEGEKLPESFNRLLQYGERTRLAVGFMLVWQNRYQKKTGQTYRFYEKHLLQAGDFADRVKGTLSLVDFAQVLTAAWEVKPCKGYDPLFHCRHSHTFTLFLKHCRTMEDELSQGGLL